jgi:hypothetical protein
MDMNFPGARLRANRGTAAIQSAPDVMVIERALHRHLVIGGHRA